MTSPERDPRFVVHLLAATPDPQRLIWRAMHQDYSEAFVAHEEAPPENVAGSLVVKHLLLGNRGHYGPLEHPQLSLNVGWFPHSVMQQARTHRVGVSFDVQSLRYTGDRICYAARGEISLDEVFYLRPVGFYTDRQGNKYNYTLEQRHEDFQQLSVFAKHYAKRVNECGFSEEHARGLLAYDVRQHFVLSFNVRSLMHFLDLRAKLDAQLEIRQLCDLIYPHFARWVPAIAVWYETHRLGRARLAP